MELGGGHSRELMHGKQGESVGPGLGSGRRVLLPNWGSLDREGNSGGGSLWSFVFELLFSLFSFFLSLFSLESGFPSIAFFSSSSALVFRNTTCVFYVESYLSQGRSLLHTWRY